MANKEFHCNIVLLMRLFSDTLRLFSALVFCISINGEICSTIVVQPQNIASVLDQFFHSIIFVRESGIIYFIEMFMETVHMR